MAKLAVNFTIEVDIKDGALTEDQIESIAQTEASQATGCNAQDLEWEWVTDPKPIDQMRVPHDDYWMNVGSYTVATNGMAIVFKDCDYPDFTRSWLKPTEKIKDMLHRLLIRTNFANLPKSTAHFDRCTEFYKSLNDLEVRSKDNKSLAYFLSGGKLVAAIMPKQSHYHETGKYDIRFG